MKLNKKNKNQFFSVLGIALATTSIILGLSLSTTLGQRQLDNKDNTNQEISINNLSYSLNPATKQATVLGFGSKISVNNKKQVEINTDSLPTDLVIPGVIGSNGQYYKVTDIATGAFFNCNLDSITLPNTIQNIGADAFANNHLTNVTLPDDLQILGNNAFSNNWFKYNTTIYLPSSCQWNKFTNACPFNCTYNLGYFTPGVQNIVQNGAVCNWNALSSSWTILSYQPSIAIGQKDNVVIKPGMLTYRADNDPLTQPASTHFNYGAVPIATNSSIQTTRILFENPIRKVFLGELSFINNKISLTGNSWGWYRFPNDRIKMSVYSNNLQKNIFDGTLNVKNCAINGLTLQNGDILTFDYTNISSINFYTNVPTNQTINANSALGSLDLMYSLNNENPWKQTQSVSFMVTPDGFVPYQNLIYLNVNVLNANTTGTTAISGHALANHQVTFTYNNKAITTNTNVNGDFTVLLPNPVALNTVVQVNCIGCQPATFKLIGQNPINSWFLFRVDKYQFGICPNGYTNKFELWNTNLTQMPDYNNPNLNITSDNVNYSNLGQLKTNTQVLLVNNQYSPNNPNKIVNTSSVYLNFSSINNATSLYNAVSKLNYNPNLINQVSISYTGSNPMAGVCSNGMMISANSTTGINESLLVQHKMNNAQTYLFNVTNNNISDANGSWNANQLGGPARFMATNYMLIRQSDDGALQTDNYASNWYDPTPYMWQTVRNITANLQTTYQKATALCEWVSQNMHYTNQYCYHHPISGTFNHLMGVCGNYSALLAVMGQMAGLVTRSIRGLAYSTPNYFSQFWIADHQWTQVWDEQMGEWITLDPTWWWYMPYGQVQSSMNWSRADESVTITMWPRGTNYFSYFKGHEDQALWNLGCSYGVQINSQQNIYPAQSAVNLTYLLNMAGSMKNGQTAYVDENASLNPVVKN